MLYFLFVELDAFETLSSRLRVKVDSFGPLLLLEHINTFLSSFGTDACDTNFLLISFLSLTIFS